VMVRLNIVILSLMAEICVCRLHILRSGIFTKPPLISCFFENEGVIN